MEVPVEESVAVGKRLQHRERTLPNSVGDTPGPPDPTVETVVEWGMVRCATPVNAGVEFASVPYGTILVWHRLQSRVHCSSPDPGSGWSTGRSRSSALEVCCSIRLIPLTGRRASVESHPTWPSVGAA